MKRALDVVLVLAASPAWLPLLAACALLIKLSNPKAPVFFIQRRTGAHGRPFDIYKFRTMIPDAHLLAEKLTHLNQRPGHHFKIKHDPRITKSGHYLRRFYLDELPQLLNVLVGQMSLVGPRPTSAALDCYALWHTERLEAVPGLTGIWQLHEDEYPSFDDRVRLDIFYYRNRCLTLDLQIIARTAMHMLCGKGC